MKYRVTVQPEAQRAANRIYDWIAERAPAGAESWYRQFMSSVASLEEQPERFGFAPENEFVAPEIRQIIFKTKRGLPYRALYRVVDDEVQILGVRGPGQQLLGPEDLPGG